MLNHTGRSNGYIYANYPDADLRTFLANVTVGEESPQSVRQRQPHLTFTYARDIAGDSMLRGSGAALKSRSGPA